MVRNVVYNQHSMYAPFVFSTDECTVGYEGIAWTFKVGLYGDVTLPL